LHVGGCHLWTWWNIRSSMCAVESHLVAASSISYSCQDFNTHSWCNQWDYSFNDGEYNQQFGSNTQNQH
jgi:hypothetical protein